MLNIITSRHIYTTLQAKIDSAIANNRISSPVVRDSEARTLPYLQAVIKEGLRIFPQATVFVGLLDGAMHVWAVLYRATRTKALCVEGSH
jgi:hypothetical protein